jgi:hypothetical protein
MPKISLQRNLRSNHARHSHMISSAFDFANNLSPPPNSRLSFITTLTIIFFMATASEREKIGNNLIKEGLNAF